MSDIAVDGATPENEGRLGGAHPPVVREIEQFVRAMIENMEPDPGENPRPGRGRLPILPGCTMTAISIWAVFSLRARASGARRFPSAGWR